MRQVRGKGRDCVGEQVNDAQEVLSCFELLRLRGLLPEQKLAFLRAVAQKGLDLHGPAFVTLEVACALARRAGDSAVGTVVGERLRAHPALTLHRLDERFSRDGARARHSIPVAGRRRDAAAAKLLEVPLNSWDDELVERAKAVTPDTWLTAHA